jgi:phage portal protein BeeE
MPWQWPWRRHDRDLFQIGDLPLATTYAAVPVNPSTAMQHSAVWACVNLIVDRAGAGLLPSQVELLAPERVQVEVNGRVIWRIDGQEVDAASIWHVKAFTAPGQVLGLSPIAHARQAIGLGLGADKYAAKFFGESGIPSGVLTTDQDIKPDRAAQIKERWKARHQGNRDIAVLGTSLTYANVEQRALEFLTFGLRRWMVTAEYAYNRLLSSTTTVKFNAAALVRTDLLTRYQAHESAIRAGGGPGAGEPGAGRRH